MKLTKKIIMEALHMFCDADHPKVYLQKPKKEGDYIFSSDGFSMVWCDKNIISSDDIKTVQMPMFNSVIPNYDKHVFIAIDVKKMVKFFNRHTPLVDEMVIFDEKCPTCKGKGFIISKSINGVCPECEGDKTIQIERPTGKKVPDNNTRYYDGESMFIYWQIMRILRLAELLKINQINMKHGANHDPYYYEIGPFKALMMPIQHQDVLIKSCIQFRY